MKSAIVLAAGKGIRMKSALNKVMYPALSKPMIGHIVDTLKASGAERIATVVGYGAENVEGYLQDSIEYAIQQPQSGTEHAVIQANVLKGLDGDTIVVNSDGSCIQKETVQKVFEDNRDAAYTVLTSVLSNGERYGRTIQNAQGMVEKIVEAKDYGEEESEVREIDTRIFYLNNKALLEGLKGITNSNAQQEYHLTDLVEIFNKKDLCVNAITMDDSKEAAGVNDRVDLAKTDAWVKRHVNEARICAGVTTIDPDNTCTDAGAVIDEDTVIYPNVHIRGKTIIGRNTVILSNPFLCNAVIGDDVAIDSSKIAESSVGDRSTVGPMFHLRNNTEICEDCRIGNFVESKNFHFGDGSKCAHLTYIGGSNFGKRINVGRGVVTINYDGKREFRTTIHDGAFVGSNCNLAALATIGENALLVAGSMIMDSVDDGDIGVVRA